MMLYDFSIKLGSQNFTIDIAPDDKYGYFEHNELGDECGGGLWFDDELKLTDYDGVFELPNEVKVTLYKFGYIRKEEYEDY